jgi:dihydrodipicolinate synthase/N-acetylneuraminate lyase
VTTTRLAGAITALITPCTPDGTVDIGAIRPLVEAQVDAGIVGLFVLGTAGQGPMFSTSERKELLREITSAAADRLAVIAHIGAMPTAAAVELAADATEAGAYAISSVPPVYYRPDALAVTQYYRAISQASALPLLAYNNPPATGVDLRPSHARALHDEGLIAGVKQASESVADLHALLTAGVPVWMANSTLNTAALAMGARGTISTITNVVPELFVRLFNAMAVDDVESARSAQMRIDAVASVLRSPTIGALHAGVTWRGLPGGQPRSPLRMPNDVELAAITRAVDAALA